MYLELATTTDDHLGAGCPILATDFLDSLDNIQPFNNLPEDHMLAVEPSCLGGAQKELGATVDKNITSELICYSKGGTSVIILTLVKRILLRIWP